MDEDQLASEAQRGAMAEQLLANEVLMDSFEYLKKSYVEKWLVCKTPELRESAWYLIKALETIQEHLVTVLNNGRLADRQIEELVKRRAERSRAA